MSKPTPIPDADAHIVDTHGFDMDRYCGAFVLQDPTGDDDSVALVETGPSTTWPRVMDALDALGIAPERVTHVLPTHIHLDHAGAAWQALEAFPNATAYVHAKGLPFVTEADKVDKLLSSVQRAVGDRFPLYGTFEALPEDRVVAVNGGEAVDVAGRRLTLIDAPGHAPHQYVVHDPARAVVYVGDAAGIRTPNGPILMTTPPPRFDLAAWRDTLDRLEALDARWFAMTHYGWVSAPDHLAPFRDAMEGWVDAIKRHKQAGDDLGTTIAAMEDDVQHARQVYDEAAFKEEVEMNTTGVWLWLERGA